MKHSIINSMSVFALAFVGVTAATERAIAEEPEFFWERPLAKARIVLEGTAEGFGFVNGQMQGFGTTSGDDTGLVVEEHGQPQLGSVHDHADGRGNASGETDHIGSLVFNPPDQSVTSGALEAIQTATIEAGQNEWVRAIYRSYFQMEAKHTLESNVHPPETEVLCLLKVFVAWSYNGLGGGTTEFWLDCDWLILGWPGTPMVYTAGGHVCVQYDDGSGPVQICSEENFVEDAVGGLYVDIPGVLSVGDEVEWKVFMTGPFNFRDRGSLSSGGPIQTNFSSITEAWLWMHAVEEY